MPIDDGYGFGEFTDLKQEQFRGFVDYHLQISQGIISKNPAWLDRNYWYFDLNAGPGIYTPGIRQIPMFSACEPCDALRDYSAQVIGSPITFIDRAESKKVPYVARFIEIIPRWSESLCRALANITVSSGKYTVERGDHDIILPGHFQHPQERLGLVYSDESGRVPPFELLGKMMSHHCNSRLDLLVYVAAANTKRDGKGQRILDYLSLIDKKHWIIREPCGKHQWSFLFGTNWANFPAWEKRGFYSLESAKGQEIMRRLNSTAKELEYGAA